MAYQSQGRDLMAEENQEHPHEIIIVKRARSHEEGHHGGAWKIAYADFVTAMMAFFLVMWLINASNDDLRSQVASYFNPIKLTDSATNPKGLKEMESGAHGAQNKVGNSEEEDKEHESKSNEPAEAGKPKFSEEALFKDPYGVLEQIARRAVVGEEGDEPKPVGGAQKDGHDGLAGGEAYRDPFDPAYWQLIENATIVNKPKATLPKSSKPNLEKVEQFSGPSQIKHLIEEQDSDQTERVRFPDLPEAEASETPNTPKRFAPEDMVDPTVTVIAKGQAQEEIRNNELAEKLAEKTDIAENAESSGKNMPKKGVDETESKKNAENGKTAKIKTVVTEGDASPESIEQKTDPASAQTKDTATQLAKNVADKIKQQKAGGSTKERQILAVAEAQAKMLEDRIRQEIKGSTSGKIPNVEVKATSEGLLISLTDEYDFGMFDIGSAQPNPGTIVAMDKIALFLGRQKGSIVLRGFTDARRFKSKAYDNWRLSTDRAHIAYYMLTRAGIKAERFERIEGYADTRLRVPDDPLAARNRRIEILLRNKTA